MTDSPATAEPKPRKWPVIARSEELEEAPAPPPAPKAPKATARDKAQATLDTLDRKIARNTAAKDRNVLDFARLEAHGAELAEVRTYIAAHPALRDQGA